MHIPVLQKEVLEYLDPKPNENFIDCTIGEAGHSLKILEKNGPKGVILGIDHDPEILKNTKYRIQDTRYKNRVILVCDNFANLKEIVKKESLKSIKGILFDLGFSSWHLEESGRGFSFLREKFLDMRYNPENPLTAEKILNFWSEKDIEKILKEYGEEKFSKRIARNIVEARKIKPIRTTFQLVEIINKATPKWYERGRIHPATRTFQALRIAVNDELNNLTKALPQAVEILELQGRLVVISFQSLEDRIVKNFFREKEKAGFIKIIAKKPVSSTEEEIKINPRARSAKLRAAIKII
jgi:16S rRNA (cytosine1402-N4)-methyltransferase